MKIFTYGFLSFLFLTSFLFIGCGSDNLVKKGEDALANADYEAAAKYFKKATKKNPSAIPLFYNLGSAAMRAGDKTEAIAAFREVLRFIPGDSSAMESLAAVLRDEGSIDNLKESHELLSQVVALADISPFEKSRALTSLALTDMAFHRSDLALAHLLTAMAITPNYAPAVYNLAKLYADELKQYPLANTTMLKFQAMDSSDSSMLEKANDFITANKTAVAAAAQKPYVLSNEANNLLSNAINEYNKKNYQKSVDLFNKTLEIAPRSYEAAFYKANALYYMNKMHDSLNAYALAADIDTTKLEAVSTLASVNYSLGNTKEAIRILTTIAIPKWPTDANSIRIATYAFAKENRYYEAVVYGDLLIATLKNAQLPTNDFETWLNSIKKSMITTFRP